MLVICHLGEAEGDGGRAEWLQLLTLGVVWGTGLGASKDNQARAL